MSSRLLALPAELKVQIAESLTPFSTNPAEAPFADCRTLADDIETVYNGLENIRSLSMTCKDMRVSCGHLLFQAVNLTDEKYRMRFMEELDNGMLPVPLRDAWNARFLRAGRYIHCEELQFQRPDDIYLWLAVPSEKDNRTWTEEDLADLFKTEIDRSIGKLFKHFPSITTLDLVNLPLSPANLHALEPLKALRTLSIRDPGPTFDLNGVIDYLEERRSFLPPVSSMSVLATYAKHCWATNWLFEAFEPSLVMLSLKCRDYGVMELQDFLEIIVHAYNRRKRNLKHLVIDCLQFRTGGLNTLLSMCKDLESLAVDCRGTSGFLPLFYIVDLLRVITGETDSTVELIDHDHLQLAMVGVPPDRVVPYLNDGQVWRMRLSRFSCRFAISESGSGPVKTLEDLELIFATGDENLEPINTNIRLSEFLVVLRARAPTFCALKTLALATSDEVPFESVETEAELKEAVAVMCRDNLPSVRKVIVDWGQVDKFFWIPSADGVDGVTDISTE